LALSEQRQLGWGNAGWAPSSRSCFLSLARPTVSPRLRTQRARRESKRIRLTSAAPRFQDPASQRQATQGRELSTLAPLRGTSGSYACRRRKYRLWGRLERFWGVTVAGCLCPAADEASLARDGDFRSVTDMGRFYFELCCPAISRASSSLMRKEAAGGFVAAGLDGFRGTRNIGNSSRLGRARP